MHQKQLSTRIDALLKNDTKFIKATRWNATGFVLMTVPILLSLFSASHSISFTVITNQIKKIVLIKNCYQCKQILPNLNKDQWILLKYSEIVWRPLEFGINICFYAFKFVEIWFAKLMLHLRTKWWK